MHSLGRRFHMMAVCGLLGWFGLLGLLGGCGASATGSRGQTEVMLSEADQAQADRLFGQLKSKHTVHRDREVVEIASNLVDYYPAFPGNAEALFLAIESAQRLGDVTNVARLTNVLLADHGTSSYADRVLLAAADTAVAAGDTLAAVGYLVTYSERHPASSGLENPLERAADLVPSLNSTDLAALMSQNSGGSLWTYLGFLRVTALQSEGQFGAEAADLLAEMQTRYPADYWTERARENLASGHAGGRTKLIVAEINPLQVGVMAPLTGRYAVLGNAFYDAALLATQKTNLDLGTEFVLKLEDSAADPVTSILAARSLCIEQGCIAIVGGLLSAPTAAAAVVCDFYGVPLVSPTATNASIWKVGPTIFQTNVTDLYEIRLLAELATSILLKERMAILAPDSPDGQRQAQVFRAEVESRGGEIVAEVVFATQSTDFKDQILQVRKARPEVIFVPATVDQMVQLGPQLDFYKAGSLIMGLSNWNSRKLQERSGTILERAIFPDDLVMFDQHWEAEFNRLWNRDVYPPEATAQALKAYQATRILLVALAESGATDRRSLANALEIRLSSQDLELVGPESYAATMRMFTDEKIVPFPAGMFRAGWALNEGALPVETDTGSTSAESTGAKSTAAESDDAWGNLSEQN